MAICYLSLGSNLGNREKNIQSALKRINSLKGTKLIKRSRIIETLPLGCLDKQNKFLNAAAKIKTNLAPLVLLRRLKDIEEGLGRPQKHPRNHPRTIDLDILFYGDKIIDSKALKVPHPRLFERDFVLKPLSEVI